jgi:hypothetical protein
LAAFQVFTHGRFWVFTEALKTYKDFPHDMPATQADTINSDL